LNRRPWGRPDGICWPPGRSRPQIVFVPGPGIRKPGGARPAFWPPRNPPRDPLVPGAPPPCPPRQIQLGETPESGSTKNPRPGKRKGAAPCLPTPDPAGPAARGPPPPGPCWSRSPTAGCPQKMARPRRRIGLCPAKQGFEREKNIPGHPRPTETFGRRDARNWVPGGSDLVPAAPPSFLPAPSRRARKLRPALAPN